MDIRTHRFLLAGGISACVLAYALPALAQDDPVELKEVVVDGAGEDASGVGEVKGVVARKTRTGSKTPTALTEIPQSVSVVGRTEMDDQGAQKTDEALRYTSGVFTQPFGSDSDTNWMFIRGFQATQSGTYMDGLQLFAYGFGSFYVDSFGLERIEVLKGPASVLYGGSNAGGMVNYVSKRADFERHRYVETGINDAGTAYVGFDVGDVASETVSARIVGRISGGDGYSDYQEGWRGFIAPSIQWKPDEQTSLTILGNYTQTDETHTGVSFLPYEGTVVDRIVDGVNYGRIDPDSNFSEPSVDTYERQQGSLGYEFSHTFDNDWTVRSNARYGAAKIHEVQVYANGWASPTELYRVDFEHETSIESFLWDNQMEGKVEAGGIEHTLLAGIDYKYFKLDQVQSASSASNIDAFDPTYPNELYTRYSYLNQELTQHQVGVYGQDQMRFGDGWIATLNGRYDWGWLSSHNGPTYWSPSQDTYEEREDGSFSGRAGLAYEFDNGVTPYASVASFFNPIIGTDYVTGKLFLPEEGVQYEVGVKYAPTFIDGLFTVSLFDLTRQNVPIAYDTSNSTQVGEMRSRGIEVEAKVNVTDNLKLTGAFTAYDIEITKAYLASQVGKTPYTVPEVLGSVSADYTFRGAAWYDGLTIGGVVRYVGSSWADNENTKKVPEVFLADLKFGYSKDNWGVDLNVTNLFDKIYVAACQGVNVCSYGEGRSIKLKAHRSW
jgi:iron complex outermembrane receptor protein